MTDYMNAARKGIAFGVSRTNPAYCGKGTKFAGNAEGCVVEIVDNQGNKPVSLLRFGSGKRFTLGAGILAVAALLGGLVYTGTKEDQIKREQAIAYVEKTKSSLENEYSQAKTAEEKMRFIRKNLVIQESFPGIIGSVHRMVAAQKIGDLETDQQKITMILEGLVTIPGAFSSKEGQTMMVGFIQDLALKEKVKQLLEEKRLADQWLYLRDEPQEQHKVAFEKLRQELFETITTR